MTIAPQREHSFKRPAEALGAIRTYRDRLRSWAEECRIAGEEPRDQSHPDEIFALRPPGATRPPLVLLGGMGPAVGADGFERACLRFGTEREIILLQACSIPCRTAVLMRDGTAPEGRSPERHQLMKTLEEAVVCAASYAGTRNGTPSLVVLCNTVHSFLPELFTELQGRVPGAAIGMRFISLVDSTLRLLKRRSYRRVLALYTVGTRISRIYSRPFEEAGIPYVEPLDVLQQTLQHSIVDGVKALNDEVSLRSGEAFFLGLLNARVEADCILAGCTEIPRILRGLMEQGHENVRRFLARATVIDPVESALEIA